MRDIGDLKEIERHVKFKRDIGKCKGRFRKICGRYRNIREETRRSRRDTEDPREIQGYPG
jgi:hypothetical protein